MRFWTLLSSAVAATALLGGSAVAIADSISKSEDDHMCLLNAASDAGDVALPNVEPDLEKAKAAAAASSQFTATTDYSYSSLAKKKALLAAKAPHKTSEIPMLWIAVSCALAGMGLVIVGSTAWQRFAASNVDWTADRRTSHLTHQRWTSAKAGSTLASKLIQAERNDEQASVVISESAAVAGLRRAA